MGKREKKVNGHDKNYGLRVMSYALFAGFNGMETTVIAFLSYYMTDSVFLAAGVTGAIIACAKVFDGVSDVVAGYLIDRTHTKWGKARPYSLFAVLMWVGIILLFSVPQSFSMPVKCIYLFVIYVLTDSVFRTLAVTSDPVHYRYGFNQKEQLDSIAIWGTCGGLIGLIAGIIIPALVASFQGRENGWTIIMVVNLFLIDCMKYTEWKEGVKAEGILSAITSLAQKLGAASALLLSGVVLQAFGYDGSQAVQAEGALDAIYGMYIILPIVLMIVAFIFLYFYKLEDKLPQIEAELVERKGVVND